MKKGIEYLELLIENLGEEWKQKLDEYLKDNTEEILEEDKEILSDFLNVCREDVISNNTNDLHLIEEKMDNNLLYNNMRNFVKESLDVYYLVAPIRSLAVKDEEKAAKLIEEIFDQVILRFNPEIIDKYEDFGFADQDEFLKFLNMFDSFCAFMAEKNYYYTTIEKISYNSFRFPKTVCKQISKIIDSNFQQIKINYIIDKLKERE